MIRYKLPKKLFCFWTGNNEMSKIRKKCFNTLTKSGLEVILITPKNLNKYILPSYPLHKGYKYLSNVHKSDYLRCYFMRFYGGGYSDIKNTQKNWLPSFKLLKNSPNKWAIGYPESKKGVAKIYNNPKLGKILKNNTDKLIGTSAYIFKSDTLFVIEWYDNMIKLMDQKYKLLKENPANYYRDYKSLFSSYPFRWAELLGEIFHPLCFKYKDYLLNTLPPPKFYGYRDIWYNSKTLLIIVIIFFILLFIFIFYFFFNKIKFGYFYSIIFIIWFLINLGFLILYIENY